MQPSAFHGVLADDAGFAALLDDRNELAPTSYIRRDLRLPVANTYHYLLSLDLRDEAIAGPMNAVDALTQFMDRRRIAYARITDRYRQLFNLALDVQPAWLDLDAEFLERNVLDKIPPGLGKTAAKKWGRERLREMFRFAARPPRWVQSPAWPIRGDIPLVFMGQVTVEQYFHDRAVLYVFHDPSTGEFETVDQIY